MPDTEVSDTEVSDNQSIAQRLREMAGLLEAQGANPFRVSAYRKAGDVVAGLREDVRDLFEERGGEGLETIPGVGKGIASAMAELLTTGRWIQLERLRGAVEPCALFQTIPGVGEDLAHRIHDVLAVDTLEALEAAAHEGRLESVPGIGSRRAAAISASLTSMLDRVRRRPRLAPVANNEPSVVLLLEIDREYRDQAATGKLPTIAPKRFNPEGESWLPILHADRNGWHFTALFSNTQRAHELGMTGDWLVIYFYDDEHHVEGQRTVVTETRGPMVGKRTVRGRERECQEAAGDELTGSSRKRGREHQGKSKTQTTRRSR
ncbi:MAG TPA: helix-hairpin-helix domain-containing protein [Burkholderiales bacterium]|nr:helix-hairpin-helix domain-containing protein [Burkholderiales bacterium]